MEWTAMDRKAAIAAYKERKSVCGIYALRCAPSGEVWVGYAADMEKIRNRLGFILKSGATPHRTLRDAVQIYGGQAIGFEVLEERNEEEPGFARDAWRKARLAHWREQLGAVAI
jgi:hypothetical protein